MSKISRISIAVLKAALKAVPTAPTPKGRPFFYFLLAVLLAAAVITVPGCWDRREPDLLGIVIMAAFDYKDDPEGESRMITVIAQVANPLGEAGGGEGNGEGGGGQKPPFWVVEASGHTAYEAVKNLELVSTRRLIWSHLEVLVFSEKLARSGFRPVLDFFDRDRQSRLISRPFVVQGDVRRLMKASFPMDDLGGPAITRQLTILGFEHAILPEVNSMQMLVSRLSNPGVEVILPRLLLLDGENGAEGEGEGEGEDEGTEEQPPPPLKISGSAVFRGDKMVGFLEERETAGYLWITGNVRRVTIVQECPWSEGEGDYMTVEIFENTAELTPMVENGELRFKLEIFAEGRIQDFNCDILSLEEDFIDSLNRRVATVIRNEAAGSLERVTELQADVFGLGNAVYRLKPQEWEQIEDKWSSMFPEAMLDIEVKAITRRPGLIVGPIRIR